MTTYGTIPTAAPPSSSSSSNLEIISKARHRIQANLGTQRPWMDMILPHYLGLPSTFGQTVERVKANATFFRVNYAIITLFILFVSLLWHPISLAVFIIMMAAWLFLYFLRRGDPLMVCDRVIDDRVVMVALSLSTIIALFFTNARNNLLVALSVSLGVIVLHGALRETQDFFLEYDQGLDSVVGGPAVAGKVLPLKHAASSSFSLP